MTNPTADNVGNFTIEVLQFRPIGPISSSATITFNKNDSDTDVFSLKGQRIYINQDNVKPTPPVCMIFTMSSSDYIFSGATFMDTTDEPVDQHPHVTIETPNLSKKARAAQQPCSKMTINNYKIIKNSVYDYVIFIQNRKTSAPGIIDPDIETNAGGNVDP